MCRISPSLDKSDVISCHLPNSPSWSLMPPIYSTWPFFKSSIDLWVTSTSLFGTGMTHSTFKRCSRRRWSHSSSGTNLSNIITVFSHTPSVPLLCSVTIFLKQNYTNSRINTYDHNLNQFTMLNHGSTVMPSSLHPSKSSLYSLIMSLT